MTDLATYLAGLKAGDVVTIDTGGRYVRQKTVDRITPTTVIVDGDKYHRTGDAWKIGRRMKKAATGRNGRWDATWTIKHPDEAANQLRRQAREQAIWAAREALSGPLTLSTIPAMRAALDRAEAALREGEQ